MYWTRKIELQKTSFDNSTSRTIEVLFHEYEPSGFFEPAIANGCQLLIPIASASIRRYMEVETSESLFLGSCIGTGCFAFSSSSSMRFFIDLGL